MATIDSLDIQIAGSVKKANNAVNSLVKNLDKLANSLKIDTSGLEKIGKSLKLNGIDKAAKNVQSQMKNIEKSIENPLNKTEDTIQKMIKSFQKTFSESGKDFKFEGNAGQLEKEIQKVNAELDRLEKRKVRAIELKNYGSLKGIIRDIENATNRLKILEDARPDALNRTLEETQKKAKESESALSEMNAKLKDLVVPPIREDNIEKLQAMLKKAEEELDRLRAKLKNGLTMGTINQSADDKGFQNLSAQIAVAEKRAEMLRQKIQDIGGSSKSTAGLEVLSSAFRGLGQAAGKAATTIKSALKGIASIVSGAFSKIGQIGSRTASTIKNVASNIASSFAKIGSSSKSLKTAHSNLGNLLKTALGFATLRGVFNFAKEAVNLGSSITEVENVVNTAFGSMAQHAYDFASTATEQFGLSELAAKQYSGTMMAMLKSSGVAQAQATKMSTTLAGLAGDIASFYNIETDEAFYKLRAAISGETEPMKALGVNMNIVNLEAFAMSQGINKAYKEMTLAEQATLRYNYIMAKTTDAQGDFARTVDSFANQWRLLKLNIQSVAAVLGQGIIAGILPIIKALNALMGKLMQAAKAFRNFMYVLMGKKIESTTSGIVNDLGGIGDAAGNLGELGDAAEEAGDKLKKNIFTLPFDELNILTDTSDDLKDSLDGIGDVDVGMGDAFEGLTEEPVNEWAKRIRDAFLAQDWEGLGKTIAELVNIGLNKVYDAIIDIIPKVEKALKAFAEVFNSFVKYLDWDLLGRTIGAGINLITTAINALLGDGGIDFEQLGNKLSVGFRGMIDEIDWTGLGNAIGNWFMVAWRIADGFIQDMWRISTETMKNGWEELGEAVGEGVNGVFDRIQFDQIARVLTEGFRGILESAASALDTIRFDEIAEKINAGLAALENGIRWEHIGEQITKFTSAVSKAFNDLLKLDFGSVGRIIGNGITDIVRAFNQLTGDGGLNFEQLGANISNGLRNLFASIPWTEFGNALGNGFMIGWRILDGFVTDMSQKDGAGLTGWARLGQSLASAVNGIFEKIDFASIADVLARGFNGLVDIIANFTANVNWDDIAKNISDGLNTLIHGINWKEAGATFNQLMKDFLGMLEQAAENTDWEALGKGIGDFLGQIEWGRYLEAVAKIIVDVLGGLLEGLAETPAGRFAIRLGSALAGINLMSHLLPFVNNIAKFFSGKSIGQLIAGGLKKMFSNAIAESTAGISAGASGGSGILSTIGAIASKIGGLLTFISGAVMAVKNFFAMLKDGFDWLHEILMVVGVALAAVGAVILGAPAVVAGIVAAIVAAVGTAVVVIKEHWEEIKEFFANLWQGIKDTAVEAWNGIGEFLGNLWQGIRDTATSIWNGIGEFFSGVWDGIRTTAETVWNGLTEFLGNAWNFIYETAINAWNGISEFFGSIWEGIKSATESIWNGITTFLSTTWETIKSIAATAWEAIKNTVINVWNGVSETFANIWNGIKNLLESAWSAIQSTAQTIWDSIKKFINNIWEGVQRAFSTAWSLIKGVLNVAWQSIKTLAQSIWNGIKKFFLGIWNGVKEVFSSTWGIIKSTLEGIWNGIKTAATTIFGGLIDSIKGIFNGIIEFISGVFSGNWERAWNGIVSIFKNAFNIIPSVVEGVLNGAISGINGLINGINNIGGNIGITLPNIPTINLPRFATGGFPEDGLFLANHTELVGRFSNGRTAVANNEQIIAGIEGGVYRGFMRAIAGGRDTSLTQERNALLREQSGLLARIADIAIESVSRMDESILVQKDIWSNQMNSTAALVESIRGTFRSLSDAFFQIGSNMAERFMGATERLSNLIRNVVYSTGERFMEAIKQLKNSIRDDLSSMRNMFSSALNSSINFRSPSFGLYSVPAYATGGFPEDGWFRASHGEMIGRFDNGQSVVANNTQIVDGIRQGVKEAVSDALVSYLSDIAENTRRTAEKDMSVRIGDRDIHEANKRAEARLGWSF